MDSKINSKDLINVGIFTALYFVVCMVVAFIGFIPILMVIMPAACALIGAIPFMLFLTRVDKFGMVTLMGTILGLVTVLMGRPLPALLFGVAAGLLADLFLKSSNYSSTSKSVVGCAIFSLWIMGMALPMFFGYHDAYLESLRSGYGDAYVQTLAGITPDWMFFVNIVLIFVAGLAGGFIGSKVLKKHFVKAGMA
ncbi:MptD family putative ECF transporter S component [Slackia heliotrinireducens]|jgi:energy-coupling factor transport system substrate-specific component|uniref:MptD family putative ECF transporter S component n=1 Tax=Slackia heliotrinireducens TaxID=84110 RepID=UPI0033147B0A